MQRYSVKFTARTGDDLDEAERRYVLDHVADVMDALAELEAADERLRDADMSVKLDDRLVILSVDVDGISSIDEAVEVGRAALRTASWTPEVASASLDFTSSCRSPSRSR